VLVVALLCAARAHGARDIPAAPGGRDESGASSSPSPSPPLAQDDAGGAGGGGDGGGGAAAVAPGFKADDAPSYAADPAGASGAISVPPSPLDPNFLPNFNCKKIVVSRPFRAVVLRRAPGRRRRPVLSPSVGVSPYPSE